MVVVEADRGKVALIVWYLMRADLFCFYQEFLLLPEKNDQPLSPARLLRGKEADSSTSSKTSISDNEKFNPNVSISPSFDIAFEEAAVGLNGQAFLSGLSFNVPRGSLTIIAGGVGSGKSTLINAILGEVDLLSGRKFISPTASRIVLSGQDSWLQRGKSLRDNITFMTPFEQSRYECIVDACDLAEDFAEFPLLDMQLATGLSYVCLVNWDDV